MYLHKVISRKTFFKLVFCWSLEGQWRKQQEPDPLVRGMDPGIPIRIHTKMSWIRNTGWESPCSPGWPPWSPAGCPGRGSSRGRWTRSLSWTAPASPQWRHWRRTAPLRQPEQEQSGEHLYSVADPHHFDSDRMQMRIRLTLMRIRMRILIFIWCGCGSGSGSNLSPWCGSGIRILASK